MNQLYKNLSLNFMINNFKTEQSFNILNKKRVRSLNKEDLKKDKSIKGIDTLNKNKCSYSNDMFKENKSEHIDQLIKIKNYMS